jgi:CHAD domain-containing protein
MSALLTLHAAAVARNLDCALTSLDSEGPHQLRVALRRLRVALRVFRPIMREAKLRDLLAAARRIGAIVGDLRDADVLIDEIMRPAARTERDARVIGALNDWRHEVRGRVRARLLAIDAPAFAANLMRMPQTFAWRKRGEAIERRLAADLVAAFLTRCRQRVSLAASDMTDLPVGQIHDLRKEVKALRYAAEFAECLSLCEGKLARALKLVQDDLGYVHDVAALERLAPPLVRENEGFARLRGQVIAERSESIRVALSSAQSRLAEVDLMGVAGASLNCHKSSDD